MKIAYVCPVEETIPPTKYGGIEWVVYNVATYLGKKGHLIDLYASEDSQKSPYYKLIPITTQALRKDDKVFHNNNLKEVKNLMAANIAATMIQKEKYDIINNHAWWRFLLFSDFIDCPIVTTHHMPLSLDFQNEVLLHYKNLPHIALSYNQQKDLPNLNYAAVIPNGIDTSEIPDPPVEKPKYDMIFLGRISPEKGPIDAAKLAHMTKKKLLVIAKIHSEDYHKEFMKYVDNDIVTFIGELPHYKAMQYLAESKLLIMPVNYEDPCPLVPLESLACGTPIVSFAQGALTEEIDDGKTGYLVNHSHSTTRGKWIVQKTGLSGLIEAVQKIFSISNENYNIMRNTCRKTAEKKFSVRRMAEDYEKTYYKIINNKKQ